MHVIVNLKIHTGGNHLCIRNTLVQLTHTGEIYLWDWYNLKIHTGEINFNPIYLIHVIEMSRNRFNVGTLKKTAHTAKLYIIFFSFSEEDFNGI